MIKIITALLLTSVAALASDGSTDIAPRTLNFILFVGILWFLLAEPIGKFFTGRTAGIAAQLNDVQKKLQESKEIKIAAAQRVEEAKMFAQNLKETTVKEQKILEDQIELESKTHLEILTKQAEAKKELERRHMVREVVSSIAGDISSSTPLSQKKMASILQKKVA